MFTNFDLLQNIQSDSVGPTPSGAGPVPLSGGRQGHNPNVIHASPGTTMDQVNPQWDSPQAPGTTLNTGAMGRIPGQVGNVTMPTDAQGNQTVRDPIADATVGITGKGDKTRINMPTMGLSDDYTQDELHEELNSIQLGQGRQTQHQINVVLKHAYPNLTAEQREHMYNSLTKQGTKVADARREFNNSEEGQFKRRFGHMSQAAQDTIRQRQQEEKVNKEIFRNQKMAQIRRAQMNPYINVAPSYGPRNFNRNYMSPQDPRAQR